MPQALPGQAIPQQLQQQSSWRSSSISMILRASKTGPSSKYNSFRTTAGRNKCLQEAAFVFAALHVPLQWMCCLACLMVSAACQLQRS
jgi:hypothetical protein